MTLTNTHLLVAAISLALALYLGARAGKKVKTADDYSLGGRSAGVKIVAGSLLGTIVGGAATVGTAQMAFSIGLSAWWFTLGCGLALVFMGLFYASKLRTSALSTVPEYLVLNYGPKAGPLASIASSAGLFFSVVASMLTSMHLIMLLFGVNELTAIVCIISSVLALVYFGGISSSGVAGLFKMALIFLTIFVAGYQAFANLGHLTGVQATYSEYYWLSLGGKNWGANLTNFFCLIVGVICTQTYVQAIFSASSAKTALLGTCIAGLITIPVGLPSVFIGLFMRLHHPEIIPIAALPLYMVTYLPEWLAGLGITAMLLSAVGSIGGISLGMSTMLTQDIYAPFSGETDKAKLLKLNRLFMLLVVVASALFSWWNMQSMVLTWNYLSMGLRGAGIFVPFTLAIFYRGYLPKFYGVAAIFLGVLTSLSWRLVFPSWQNTLLPALSVSLLICLWGMFVGKQSSAKKIVVKG